MKPRVMRVYDLGPYRNWCVLDTGGCSYFETWREAMIYACTYGSYLYHWNNGGTPA